MTTQITDVEALAGKTIERAEVLTYPEALVLVFTDGTFACASPERGYDNDVDITLSDDLGDYGRLSAGLMTQGEYDAIQAAAAEQRRAEQDARERLAYERLRAKYGTPSASGDGDG